MRTIIIAATCIVVLILATTQSNAGRRVPAISWSPSNVTAVGLPGTTTTYRTNVTFRASRYWARTFHLSPSTDLAPYVASIAPADVLVPAGVAQQVTVEIEVRVPIATTMGTTVHGSINVERLRRLDVFRGRPSWALSLVLTVLGVNAPSDWRIENLIAAGNQKSVSTGGLILRTPTGSTIGLYPYGAPGFGLNDELTENIHTIALDGLAARRRDYSDPNTGMLSVSLIAMSQVPGYPQFEIVVRPTADSSPEERAQIEDVLNSLKLQGG